MPITQAELEETAEMAMFYFMAKAEEKFKRTFKVLPLRFDLRGKAIGQAWNKHGYRYLRLNSEMLRDHPEEIVPTVAHECAHVVTALVYPEASSHGYHWGAIMLMVFDQEPNIYHNVETTKYAARKRR